MTQLHFPGVNFKHCMHERETHSQSLATRSISQHPRSTISHRNLIEFRIRQMATKVKISDHVKIAPPRATKIKTQRNQGGDELLKAVLTKRTKKVSKIESTTSTSTESKKTCISTQNLQTQKRGKLLKMPTKMTTDEKANISESKSKRKEAPKKMCTCSPTTHEGSFRCRLHRIGADKNSVSEKKSKLASCHSSRRPHVVEFKPQLSRFGRAASAEPVVTHDGLSQPSAVGSS